LTSSTSTTASSSQSSSPLFLARRRRRFGADNGDNLAEDDAATGGSSSYSLQRLPTVLSNDRPTETVTEVPEPPVFPEKPKIVVLGASGRIGRHVIRQLLERNVDATIVAFCRDYDKACRVLYDDVLVLSSRRKTRRGPKLQIVQGDLVPPEELPASYYYSKRRYGDDAGEDEEESDWLRRAESAAKFYGTSVGEYDNRNDAGDDGHEALEQAIRGCTTIISCVGSVRPTNIWTDLLARPLLRILRRDVSAWCADKRHPYYVNYVSTRKALAFAEREQLRREAAVAAERRAEEEASGRTGSPQQCTSSKSTGTSIPRIRFVRISDLCVSQHPWDFVPLVTNALHSMVFRYQDMTEQLLESSDVVDTVVLRPGDLVEEERDVQTTHLQVSADGKVPAPAIVGREDVAALAVAAALFDSSVSTGKDRAAVGRSLPEESADEQQQQEEGEGEGPVVEQQRPAFHYTLAVRWAGEDLGPYPPQGTVSDGLPDAHLCMQSALRQIRKREKLEQQRRQREVIPKKTQQRQRYYSPDSILKFARAIPSTKRKRLKPYGVCVAIPVYLLLATMGRSLIRLALSYLPSDVVRLVPTKHVGQALAAVGAFLGTRSNLLLQEILRLLGRGSQKYITF